MCGGQVSEHLEKTEYKMNKLFPGIFAMAIIVVASNILVQFFIGNWLTWGAFTYPFAFLVTDLINRMYVLPMRGGLYFLDLLLVLYAL